VWDFKWDLLFHLIPLLQFDAQGVLLGVQHVAQHANWPLVLDLLKKAPANMYVVATSHNGRCGASLNNSPNTRASLIVM
jgi:hypothetical protein